MFALLGREQPVDVTYSRRELYVLDERRLGRPKLAWHWSEAVRHARRALLAPLGRVREIAARPVVTVPALPVARLLSVPEEAPRKALRLGRRDGACGRVGIG